MRNFPKSDWYYCHQKLFLRIISLGLNSNAFLSPANDPIGSNGMHWRQLELSGNSKPGEFAKNSLRHFIWAAVFGSSVLFAVSLYRIKNDRTDLSPVAGDEADKDDILKLREISFSLMFGSFIFFGLNALMRISLPVRVGDFELE